MTTSPSDNTPSYQHILLLAWPVVVANIATPFLGLVDTAVIGHTRPAAALGAIAIGALVLNFMQWAFGFLRMSTTGFVAQAAGADNTLGARAAIFRAIATGIVFGIAIIALQVPLAAFTFPIMGAGKEVDTLARSYFGIRVWAAPATLATFAISGALIGLGRTRQLLALQLVLNGLNIALDLLFAGVLDGGVQGIAFGTLIAEWVAAIFGLFLVMKVLRSQHRDEAPFIPWVELRHAAALRLTFLTQGNIMIRTLAMLAGFGWLTRQGALLGETTLAANHVLLALISFCAFFLDGFALSAENLVGAAKGSRDLPRFDRAVRRTNMLAAATALGLALILFSFGNHFIAMLTDLTTVRLIAANFLPLAVVYVALSFGAFQLDGIFIGTTHAAEMRNASLASVILFILASAWLTPLYGNTALWLTFIGYVVVRAITLALYYPRIRRGIG
ncbi:MAG: MATE family efflux transporter [Opitutaceae bacterium]|nr:MATE family efflux transporter [Opitutaceae bacterium]